MNFVVAGAALLLSLIVGVLSYTFAPVFEKQNIESEGEVKTAPAMALPDFFAKSNWKQIVFICGISVVCALAVYFSYSPDVELITYSRKVVVLLVLFAAMIIDSRTRLIPNVLILITLGMGVIILLLEFIFLRDSFLNSLIMSISGLVCCVVLFYVLSRLTKEGIGMGDVKLISAMGFLLGLFSTLIALLFSLILCTLASIILLFGKKKNKNDRIPFGPFMFFGYIIMFIF